MTPRRLSGFTLAELLISLVILGVIATFTIPKMLVAQQDSRNNAIAKEIAAMISEAYQTYSLNNPASASTTIGALTPYMNYLRTDTTSSINANSGAAIGTPIACNAGGGRCLVLHNGARFFLRPSVSFGGATNLNALWFQVDPDGTLNNTSSIVFFLYYNGRLKSYALIDANTVSSDGTRSAISEDPDWFSWN